MAHMTDKEWLAFCQSKNLNPETGKALDDDNQYEEWHPLQRTYDDVYQEYLNLRITALNQRIDRLWAALIFGGATLLVIWWFQ